MRIPFPERVPIDRVAIFAVALFVIQRLEGTALFFSTGCAVFILIAAFAFNTAGGLSRASGAYVFFYSVLVVILGICYKAFLGEPAQSNLLDPRTTIEAYVGTIAAMFATVVVSRRLSRKTGLLQHLLRESEMYRASVGCIIAGAFATFAIGLLGESGEELQSAFAQLNQLIPLGVILGVMYEIRRSGGTRSVNLPILLGAGYYLLFGLVSFSKQGILTPLICWLLPVCALQYRLSKPQIASCLLGAFLIFHYLFPYAQYGRSFREEDLTFRQSFNTAVRLLEHPERTRQAYEAAVAAVTVPGEGGYYNTPQGFWDRLQFLSVDDSLIEFTAEGHVLGFAAPFVEEALNTIPHFIWPSKPPPRFGGNYYAHEMGNLAEEDTTTGISFSPTAEAFHLAGWTGILVIAPLLWLILFVTFDSLLGDIRLTPWGLLAAVLIAHTAPEGGILGVIHMFTFGTEIIVFCALFARWVAPLAASSVLGKAKLVTTGGFGEVPFDAPETDRP